MASASYFVSLFFYFAPLGAPHSTYYLFISINLPFVLKIKVIHNKFCIFLVTVVGEGAAALAINENLFTEEDLEGLEEELGDLDLEEWSRCPLLTLLLSNPFLILVSKSTISTITQFSLTNWRLSICCVHVNSTQYISNNLLSEKWKNSISGRCL